MSILPTGMIGIADSAVVYRQTKERLVHTNLHTTTSQDAHLMMATLTTLKRESLRGRGAWPSAMRFRNTGRRNSGASTSNPIEKRGDSPRPAT